MTVVERIIIEVKEMKGYDIEEIDLKNYTKDRITQQCEKILRDRRVK
jgi:hypothetical protein